MHVDFKMDGALAVNGGTIQDLEFSADFTMTDGVTIFVDSAIFDTIEGTRYCLYYEVEGSGRTICTSTDLRTFEYEDMVECSGELIGRRECNPSIDSSFAANYLLRGTLYPYEVTLRCSDEGLWTPPCPLDGSFNPCVPGGTCYAPDDEGWGYNLENYGYCSCSH